jgi:sulfur dioxygenase
MTTLATTPIQPYIALHLKHFPVKIYTTPSGIEIHPMWSGEGNLSYLIVNPENRQALLIDPDLEILGSYLLTLDMQQLRLVATIDTHNHAEHATAGPALRKMLSAEYIMDEKAPSSFVTDHVKDNDTRILAGIPVEFIATPGHTPHVMTVKIDGHIFTGDSLFNKSCGRTDLPGAGGDAGVQFDSLQRLMKLPDETVVHPGHDYNNQPSSTIGEVRRENKRVQFTDRAEFIRFMEEYYLNEEKPDDLAYYVAFNAR